jgi:DNA polymerase III subunit delta'
MPFSPKVERALENFRHAIASGRMPHAVLACGHPRGAGMEFALGLLGLVLPGTSDDRLLEHPDVRWIEPESKARRIRVEEHVRPLKEFIGLTSYQGGWKAGVILFADRMGEGAQNALLKTLEEPPPRSLIVLVTDVPAALLTTIRSRAQYVEVLSGDGAAEAEWMPTVMGLLRNPPPRKACEMIAWSDRLTAPLRELEDKAREEETARIEAMAAARTDGNVTKADKDTVDARVATRVKEMREEFLRTLQLWQRDVLARVQNAEAAPANFPMEEGYIAEQAAGLTFAEALRRVDVVDEIRELFEHNIRPAVVFPRLARAVSLPKT